MKLLDLVFFFPAFVVGQGAGDECYDGFNDVRLIYYYYYHYHYHYLLKNSQLIPFKYSRVNTSLEVVIIGIWHL
jgi:hypothetical protein